MEGPGGRSLLLKLLLLIQIYGTTAQDVKCQNGCGMYLDNAPYPVIITDDGTNCELVCAEGAMQGSANNVNLNMANNIVACNNAQASMPWCYSGGSGAANPSLWCSGTTVTSIVRGSMSACTGIADSTPIDYKITGNSTRLSVCEAAGYSAATTTAPTTTPTTTTTVTTTPTTSTTSTASTVPSTTTAVTTTASSTAESTISAVTTTATVTTTSATTGSATTTTGISSTSATVTTTLVAATTTAAPDVPLGLCAPFVAANGVTYDNRCTQYDSGATCNDNGEQSSCTCSAGQTGSNCGVTQSSLQTIGPLAGATSDSQSIYSMITASKASGTATFIANMPSLLSFLTDDQRASMSFDASDMIIGATYEGKSLVVSDAFTTFNDPSLGNCFTFNHWNGSYKYGARMIGPRGGLKVQANVMPEEYLPFIDTMGINVYVTEVGEHVYVESNKILSQPGGWDKLMLTRTTTQLLETHKSKCARDTRSAQSYYFDGNYSIDGCYRSCYQDSVYASCGCMDPMFSRKDGVSACTFDQVPCIFDMQARRGDPTSWDECTCHQPCFTQDYSVSYSRGLLTDEVTCAQTGNYNVSDTCKPGQSYITVAFKTLEAMVQVEVEKYPLSRVFGNFGNVGGLLLGFSMVSLFEWLFFALNMFFISINKEQYGPSAGEVRKDY